MDRPGSWTAYFSTNHKTLITDRLPPQVLDSFNIFLKSHDSKPFPQIKKNFPFWFYAVCISHLFLLKKTQCGSYVNHCHKRNYAQENNDGWKMGNFHPETLTLYNWHLVCFLKRGISVLKENSITTKLVGKVMFKILVMVLKKNLLIKGPFGAGFSSKRKVSSRGHVHAHRGALKDNRWRCRPWLKLNYSVYVLLAVAT